MSPQPKSNERLNILVRITKFIEIEKRDREPIFL